MLNNRLKQVGFVVLVWLCATLLRLPNLDRPVSKHHEFNNAAILVSLNIWEARGIAACHYAPIMTFPSDRHFCTAQKDTNSGYFCFADNESLYYTSLGAMQYWLPFYFNKILGLTHSNRNLQIFNLLLHLFALFGVFKIADLCFPNQSFAIIFSVISYAFAPSLLWFCGNLYEHETMLLPFLYLNLYLYLKALRNRKWQFWQISLYFLTFILIVLTDWVGCFWAFFIGCHAAIYAFQSQQKAYWQWFFASGLAAALGVLLVVWHFSSIVSFTYYTDYLTQRTIQRTGSLGSWQDTIGFVLLLFKNYLTSYFTNISAILLILGFGWYKKREVFLMFFSKKIDFFEPFTALVSISLCSILLHHSLLIEYSGYHDYNTVKAGLLLSLLGGWVFALFSTSIRTASIQILFLIVCCIGQYFTINRIGDYGQNGDRYDEYLQLGTIIKQNAAQDEIIFVDNTKFKNSPQTALYAGRNLFYIKNIAAAQQLLSEQNRIKGCFFHIIPNKKPIITHFPTSSSPIQ
jgi:hypothetical protein